MFEYLQSNYNLSLVAFSYLISVIGSFAALFFFQKALSRPSNSKRFGLIFIAAIALGGIGIWSMHFIGMLAYNDNTLRYDMFLTIVSLVMAIGIVTFGLATISGTFSYPKLLFSGLLVGLGVAAMHYSGMAALSAEMTHNMTLVYLSLAIALVAATAALWLLVHVRSVSLMVIASLVMGVAVCGMHYTAMGGVTISSLHMDAYTSKSVLSITIIVIDAIVLALLSFFGIVLLSEEQNYKPAMA